MPFGKGPLSLTAAPQTQVGGEFVPGQLWNPLSVNQMMSGGEGMETPRFYDDVPQGAIPTRNDAGEWGYYSPAWRPDLSGDPLHAATNPWQPQIEHASRQADAYLPSFWRNAVKGVTRGFDPARGLYDIPTSYESEDELLSDPRWWGAQDLRPEVRAALMRDPRAGYASLQGAYGALPTNETVIPQGWERLRSRSNRENVFPMIGAEGGYRSMQDLQWLPGYGIVAPSASYIPEHNEDYAKLAVALAAGAVVGGAMSGAFAAPGTAGAAMPAAGKAAWGLGQAAINRNPLSAVGALGNLGAAADLWSPQVGTWIGRGAGALGALNSAAGDPLGVRGWFGSGSGGAQLASAAPGAGASIVSSPSRSGLQSLRVPSLAMKSGII